MEKEILKLFTHNHKLKFSKIQKNLEVRSNKLTYHLKNLIKKQILRKQNNQYQLTQSAENLIPYLSEKKPVLPVILIHIGTKNKAFLYKRQKRPFKSLLSMPGGRMILGENIKQATKRILKEKFNLSSKLKTIHSISIEHLKKSNQKEISQTDIIVFVTATIKQPIQLTLIKKNKSKIISSDYKLLTSDLDKKINIKTISTSRF
jgi:ADP-ribose pyrophosphatase YjhB (NUDIX family)